MNKLLEVLTGNIGDSVAKIVGLFKVSPEVAAQNAMELSKIQADLVKKNLDATETEIQSAKEIIVAEANSQSWLPRNVRPALLAMWGTLITVNYLMGVISQFINVTYVPVVLPDWIYKLTAIGFTGYVTMRTWEKVKDADK